MKRVRFSEEQSVGILKEHEAAGPVRVQRLQNCGDFRGFRQKTRQALSAILTAWRRGVDSNLRYRLSRAKFRRVRNLQITKAPAEKP